jgi:DNA polymerase-3 subunit gamma/tau
VSEPTEPNEPQPDPTPPDVPEPAPSPDPVPTPQPTPGEPDPGPQGDDEHPLEADYPDGEDADAR